MGKIRYQFSLLTLNVHNLKFGITLSFVEGVTSLPEVISIPGNRSKVCTGIAYILGQILPVVDISPIINKKFIGSTSEVIVIRDDQDFYAIQISSIGPIISRPKIKKSTKLYQGISSKYVVQGKEKIYIINIESLVNQHICV